MTSFSDLTPTQQAVREALAPFELERRDEIIEAVSWAIDHPKKPRMAKAGLTLLRRDAAPRKGKKST